MFDATDLEVTRLQHDYEMGAQSDGDRAWSKFYRQAEAAIIANGWDGKFDNGKSRGLDGNEYTGDGEPSDGYSIDGAYEAWEARWSVERYIARVAVNRAELGAKLDFVMHGNTRCGIRQTTDFVRETYGALGDYVEADAGTAYEDYVLRKGFFGKGIGAHGFSYRILKAQPFRKAISREIRKGKRDIRVLFLNGARKDESENRRSRLQNFRRDPASPGNIWVNLIQDWSEETRDRYLDTRSTSINPVAIQLCRSGECMCGTMQTDQERAEAAAIYPEWGSQLDALEAEARRLHGFGWGEAFPKARDDRQADLFQPMCKDCVRKAA